MRDQGAAPIPTIGLQETQFRETAAFRALDFREWELGRIEPRRGLRMMPTFPRSSLSFRTAATNFEAALHE